MSYCIAIVFNQQHWIKGHCLLPDPTKPSPKPMLTYVMYVILVEFCGAAYARGMIFGHRDKPRIKPIIVCPSSNTPVAQIPQCFRQISYNAPYFNRNVYMCTHLCYILIHCRIFVKYMGLLPDTWNWGLRMRRKFRERFPRHWFQMKALISYPGMHPGTCVTHVPRCMSGSLISCGGENVPGIPGACATRNFTYLARGPLWDFIWVYYRE